MRLFQVILCLAACAVPAWAGLAHVQPVIGDARSFVRLARVEAVDYGVPQVIAAPGVNGIRSDIVAADTLPRLSKDWGSTASPVFGRCVGSGLLTGNLPFALALPGNRLSVGGDLPSFRWVDTIAGMEVDPFLTWFDIWNEGALGELRAAALKAATEGDDVGSRKLTELYWAGVSIATERRRILVGKPDNDGSGLRGSRRNGH